MTSHPDRRHALRLVDEARRAGARLAPACREAGIGVNTYRRWQRGGVDRRPTAKRPRPAHALTPSEREEILSLCHEPVYASLPPGQIVPRLADAGRYVASESSFYRVLRAAGEQHPRGRAKPPRPGGPPPRHCARGPNAVWCWDVTYLPSRVRGAFFYLYLIVDLYSRKIVGAEVFEAENAANSQRVIERAVLAERCLGRPPVLHADNGSAMKGATLKATLERLGIEPSHSRPRVSNDNAFSEALFRTCKYRPEYPAEGVASVAGARDWVLKFVRWYNREHRHSAIRFVTPAQRHGGADVAILAQRRRVYQRARANNPGRWSGPIRDWTPSGEVWLNPAHDAKSRRREGKLLESA